MIAYVYCVVTIFSPALIFLFSQYKRFTGKSLYNMTYLVLSGTLNLNSVNECVFEAKVLVSVNEYIVNNALFHRNSVLDGKKLRPVADISW